MTNMAIKEDVYNMMETVEGFCCDTCPYAEECERRELWWGCAQWEEEMGDDL